MTDEQGTGPAAPDDDETTELAPDTLKDLDVSDPDADDIKGGIPKMSAGGC